MKKRRKKKKYLAEPCIAEAASLKEKPALYVSVN